MGLLELLLAAGAYNHKEDKKKKVHSQYKATQKQILSRVVDFTRKFGCGHVSGILRNLNFIDRLFLIPPP